MYYRLSLIVAICIGISSLASAADEKEKAAPPKQKQPAAKEKAGTKEKASGKAKAAAGKDKSASDDATDPVAKFSAMFAEWKGLLAKMAELRERYQTDGSADKEALETQFQETLQRAQALGPQLTGVAEAAYLAAPNKNEEINTFMFANLRGLVSTDDHETAARLAKVMLDHDFDNKAVNYFAGMAFFGVNDFENSGKQLKLANDSENIDETGKRYLASIDKYKELWAKEKSVREAEDKANTLPKIKLTTTKGDIVVLMLEDQAPNTVANFVSLVENKFYDGLAFHRVLPGFMAQGGDPNGDGSGGPGYTIPDECRQENHRIHFRGSLSMAKTAEPDTGGSQFFLTFVPTSHLDGKHTVFGRVIDGFDVLTKLQRIEPGDKSVQPDKILKAEVISKRNHPYKPVKRADKAS